MSPGRCSALLVVLTLIPAVAWAQTRPRASALTDVTIVGGPEAVEVRVKLSRPVQPKTMLLGDPWRVVLDFPGVDFRWSKTPASGGADLIREVRGSQYEGGVARVVIELTRQAPWVVERAPDGFRVIFRRAAAQPAPPLSPSRATAPKPPTAVRPRSAPEVQGIIVRDDKAVAYIRDPKTKQVRGYRVGDRVGDAVIEKIGDREVVFTTPTGRIEVRLD